MTLIPVLVVLNFSLLAKYNFVVEPFNASMYFELSDALRVNTLDFIFKEPASTIFEELES